MLYLLFFSADEALLASKVLGKFESIMMKGWVDNTSLEWSILNGIESFVFDLDRLHQAIEFNDQHKYEPLTRLPFRIPRIIQ